MSNLETSKPSETVLSEETRDLMKRLLANPIDFPDAFKQWVAGYFAQNVPLIPYGNLLGAKVNIAKSGDYIATSEGPGPAAYGDISGGTVGPSITGLADGVYVVLWGAVTTGGEHTGYMGVSINGDTPTDADSAGSLFNTSIAHGRLITVKNDHNTSIVCKYKGTQQNWSQRWLAVIRVATGA